MDSAFGVDHGEISKDFGDRALKFQQKRKNRAALGAASGALGGALGTRKMGRATMAAGAVGGAVGAGGVAAIMKPPKTRNEAVHGKVAGRLMDRKKS